MFLRSLITAAIVSVVAAGSCARDYTVKDGDICDKISAAEGVSTYQLAVVNNGTVDDECSNLVPGEKLCLGYQGSDCNIVYVVVAGDVCDVVSAAHNISTSILYQNNPQINSDCTNIYIGEVLCVATTVTVPPPVGDKSFPIPSTATPAVPSKTPTPSPQPDSGNDEEDLPWCDEL